MSTAVILTETAQNKQDAGRIQFISTLAAVLVVILALFAFVLSYSSLQHLAYTAGVGPRLSYAWPLLLDFAMVVFSLAILRANLREERTFYPWILTVTFAGLAVVANVLDVTALGIPEVAIKAAVKALAPVALVLAFELLMGMVRAEIRRAALVSSLAELAARRSETAAELNRLDERATAARGHLEKLQGEISAEISSKRAANVSELNAARQAKIDERRTELLTLLPLNLSRGELAERLGVSEKTVRSDIKSLNGKAGVS